MNMEQSANQNMQRFIQSGVMAIIRVDSLQDIEPAIQALIEGGLDVIEISLRSPNALEAIAKARQVFGSSALVGAGTVLDSESARAAILAGAEFLATTVLRIDVITIALRYGVLTFSGAFTPSECLSAFESGAHAIYLFPSCPAGPDYLKAIRGPLPQIPLVAVGGVSLDNLKDFIKAGAVGVAGATNLVNPRFVHEGHPEKITQTAAAWLEAARLARGN